MIERPLREAVRAPESPPVPPPQAPALWHRAVSGASKALLPIAILLGAAEAWHRIADTAPPPLRSERVVLPRIVETTPALSAVAGPRVEAFGTAEAARSVTLTAEVTARIAAVHPRLVRDGALQAGDTALRMDDVDLRLAVTEAEARVAEIDARITMEEGQADRARRDFERLPLNVTEQQRALILREPQMAELRAARAAAVAARDRAAEALSRAAIIVPFDGIVLEESVEPGAVLTAGTAAARIAAIDAFETRLAVPLDALGWIAVGQPVTLSQPGTGDPEGTARQGRVVRISPALADGGRLAVVTVRIPDPLALDPENAGRAPIRLGSYLAAEIEGRPIPNAVALPRVFLRPGETAWVRTAENTLDRRALTIAWEGAETLIVTEGLVPGDEIITTDLGVYTQGMAVRLAEEAPPPEAAE
ncbi:MAG: efflux RND transporter periplasmic adaptor subunit [Pseudomonadota bacterium]